MSSLIFVVMLVVGLVALAAVFGEVIGGIILVLGAIFAFTNGGMIGIGIYVVLVMIAGGIIGRIRGA